MSPQTMHDRVDSDSGKTNITPKRKRVRNVPESGLAFLVETITEED